MERLPYIDEHSITIGATRERVWEALVSTLRANLGTTTPTPLRMLLDVAPAEARGDWRGALSIGDALPGFSIAEVSHPERLALSGHHRFSRYALVFEIDSIDAERSTLRARTSAAFPGLAGRVYRALVIGSRGHRLVVRRLLRSIAGRT
ncbi:MAG TPA: hypothetical protein VFY36_04555 [Solirubrobacteraceae bacterium]|nr:hypothetical protein [Solirubrobacteraceae bacterium]